MRIMELNDFIVVFANQFDETDPSEIQASTRFHDLDEWSYLIAMSIIAMARTEYGKTITGTELRTCNTVEDVFNVISSK